MVNAGVIPASRKPRKLVCVVGEISVSVFRVRGFGQKNLLTIAQRKES